MNMAERKLPQDFTKKMRKLLKEEYPDFLASYEKERVYGLRFNPLKAAKEVFLNRMPFPLEPVAWAQEGFYYKAESQPGRHPFHEAGAYYIQEPSAMAVTEVLAPMPGEKILDLCAAPGGKSTHIAGKMAGEGLLVSNEIITGRAKILSQNIERMGISNAVVCNEEPGRLAEFFPLFFDKILVDAPCSGEGMFRKEEAAISEWTQDNVKMCADRQRIILEQAARMLKPGGILVYSTCTFSPEENEGTVSSFLREHPDFQIEETAQEQFFESGRSEWIDNPAEGIVHTMRLFPHKIAGEGHFIARMKKEERLCISQVSAIEKITEKKRKEHKGYKERKGNEEKDGIVLCQKFLEEELGLAPETWERLNKNGALLSFGEHVYFIPKQMIPLKGLKVVRPGLQLGTVKKNRFEPSHALALYLSPDMVKRHFEMSFRQTECYLRGETFACDARQKGWTLLSVGGYSIGFGKAGGGQMKNHYPKGLRKQ